MSCSKEYRKKTVDRIHPLEIDLVSETIFKNLDLEDLKACRGVCKSWNSSALPIFQKKASVVLPPAEWKNMSDFVSCMETSWSIPCTTYVLEFWQLHLNIQAMTKFWTICGKSIKKINLRAQSRPLPTISDFQKIFEQTPNLEVLNLDALDVDLFLIKPSMLQTTCVLPESEIPILPKLKSVTLPYVPLTTEEDKLPSSVWRIHPFWLRILASVEEINGCSFNVQLSQVVIIEMVNGFEFLTNIRFQHLRMADLILLSQVPTCRLQQFTVDEFSEDVETDFLNLFLGKVKSTLLSLDFGWTKDPTKFVLTQFPIMETLEKLTLFVAEQETSIDHAYCIAPILFSRDFPKLKRLHIIGRVSEKYDWGEVFRHPENIHPCKSLTTLKFEWTHSKYYSKNLFIDEHLTAKLVCLFPSLTYLKIWPLDDEVMEAMFGAFKNLRILEIGLSRDTDFNVVYRSGSDW